MPWSGSGTFSRLYSWVSDKAAGIDITASRTDADSNDIISNGFGNCLTRDGQGAATANLPMGGFKHTNVGNGTAATDYVAVGQLKPTGNAAAVGIYGIGAVGDVKPTILPEAILPTGWYVCYGQTRPRTDPLWLATGAVNPAYWPFGMGDGATTYTLPDFRGKALFGKDDMGGTAANLVTPGVSGVVGTALGATGGSQYAQKDTPALAGTITASSAAVSTVTDPQHTHSLSGTLVGSAGVGLVGGSGSLIGGYGGTGVSNAATGITVATAVTTTVDASGLSVSSNLSGTTQNMPPAAIVNYIIFCGA